MKNITWKTCFRIGASMLLLYLCIFYWQYVSKFASSLLSALVPLIIGLCIAYPLNILMSFYERHYFPKSEKKIVTKSRRGVSMSLAIVTLVAIVVLIFWLVIPQLADCVNMLIDKFPDAMDKIVELLEMTGIVPEDIIASLSVIDWQSKLGDIAKVLTSGLGSAMNIVINAVSSVATAITSVVIGIIFAVYVLASKDTLSIQTNRIMKKYMSDKHYHKTKYLISVADDSFHNFIVGQCTEAIILGMLCTVGMIILQLPYATMIGVLTGFTSLIPVVGPLIGGGVGAFLILTQSPIQALIFLIFIIVLQQVEGNLIYPKVVGSSVGLPGMWVLAAVTIGAGVGGILGVLLGVPVMSILYRLLREDLYKPKKAPIAATVSTISDIAEAPAAPVADTSEPAAEESQQAAEATTQPKPEAQPAARKNTPATKKSYPQKKHRSKK